MLPNFPCTHLSVDMLPYLAGFGDVPDALEDHCLKYYEPLRIPAALLEYYKLCGQKSDKVTPTSTYRHVIPPCGHDLQGSPEGLPRLVIFDPPTEVRSIQLFLA